MNADQRKALKDAISALGVPAVWESEPEPEWLGNGLCRLSFLGDPVTEGVDRKRYTDALGWVREDIVGRRRVTVQAWIGLPSESFSEPIADLVGLGLQREGIMADLEQAGVFLRTVSPANEVTWGNDERPMEASVITLLIGYTAASVDNTPTGLGRIEAVNAEYEEPT